MKKLALSAAGAVLFLASTSSLVGAVTIYFEELANDGGIVIHTSSGDSGVIAGETAVVGTRACSTGCDVTLSRIGIERNGGGTFGFTMTEPGGGVSDMIVVSSTFPPGSTRVTFYSDPAIFPTGINIVGSVVETGFEQLVGTYTDDGGGTVSLSASSKLATSLPAALPLFATGLGALGLLGWRRTRKGGG